MIQKNKKQWEELGDKVATSIMTEGLNLYFQKKPKLSLNPPPNIVISEKTALELDDFIPTWLETNVIREITTPIPLHFSIIFMRPKKNGKKRPIIDLSQLNLLLVIPPFKMENGGSHCENNIRGSVGLLNRHQRWLLSRSSKLGISQILGLQGQEQSFCFPIPSVRSFASSVGFHKGHQTNKTKTPFLAHNYLQLHR